MVIYTRNGVPINQGGDDLFDTSGKQVARLQGDKAFGPDGRYIATLVDDRLIYFASDSEQTDYKFKPRTVAGVAVTKITGITRDGEEPDFYS